MKRPALTVIAATTAVALVAGCGHELQAGLSPGFGLHYNRSGPTATLAYGRANSDDAGLVLQCEAGSRALDVSDVARRGGDSLTLSSDGARTELKARLDASTGQPTLWAQSSIDAPALKAFRRTGRIHVAMAGGGYSLSADRGEQAGVEAFFRSCERT